LHPSSHSKESVLLLHYGAITLLSVVTNSGLFITIDPLKAFGRYILSLPQVRFLPEEAIWVSLLVFSIGLRWLKESYQGIPVVLNGILSWD
jgi:hypothetical protein